MDSLFNLVTEEKHKIVQRKRYTSEFDVLLANTDTLKFLKTIPKESVDLIVTSPPYNIGKVYEKRERITDYLNFQNEIIIECKRILSDKGNICWQVGNYVEKGEVYPLDIFFYDMFKNLDFKLRNRIIWHFGHGLHAKKRFSGRYETVLWFSKGNEYKFNLDPVRVPSKYPGKRHFKGSKKGQFSCNPLGKNPSDIWEFLVTEFDKALWDIPNVKSNHPEKTEHPCQYPIELIERLVLAMTDKNDVVLDPFMGVGSALIAAIIHGRRSMGVDKEKKYVEIAYDRIKLYENGTLQKRELGKPVHKPKGNEKVCQKPKNQKKENSEFKF